MSDHGNGGELYGRIGRLEAEVDRCSSRLHIVERDVCSHALEAATEARETRESVDALRAEFSRFAKAVSEALVKLRPKTRSRVRGLLDRWLA